MGCGQSKADEPIPAQTVELPTAAPMQGDQFQLTAATKKVKAATTTAVDERSPNQSNAAVNTANNNSSNSPNSSSSNTSPKPSNAPAPAIITGCLDVVEGDGNKRRYFVVVDRGVLITCSTSEESEEDDKVSEPMKLKDYLCYKDEKELTLMLIDPNQKETVFSLDFERDLTKWYSAVTAHITYRSQLIEESKAEEFGKTEVKNYRQSVRRVPRPTSTLTTGNSNKEPESDMRNKIKSAHFNHEDMQKILKARGDNDEDDDGETFSGGINPSAGHSLAMKQPATGRTAIATEDVTVSMMNGEDDLNPSYYDEAAARNNLPSPGHTESQQNPLAMAGNNRKQVGIDASYPTSSSEVDGDAIEYDVNYGRGHDVASPKFSFSRDKF